MPISFSGIWDGSTAGTLNMLVIKAQKMTASVAADVIEAIFGKNQTQYSTTPLDSVSPKDVRIEVASERRELQTGIEVIVGPFTNTL